MTAVINEHAKSRPSTNEVRGGSSTRIYNVFVVEPYTISDDADAYAAVVGFAPLTVGVWQRKRIVMEPQGGSFWTGRVEYGPSEGTETSPADPAPAPPADTDQLTSEISIDITGVQKHITQSIATAYLIGRSGATARDYNRAIGVSKDGVAGTDIQAGTMELTITRTHPFITLEYVKLVKAIAFHVNNADWWNFLAGEVLFKGAQFTIGTDNKVKGVYKFNIGERQTDVDVVEPVGGLAVLRIPLLDPNNYVWCTYEDVIETVGGVQRNVSRPKEVYVEEVYPVGDFSVLVV